MRDAVPLGGATNSPVQRIPRAVAEYLARAPGTHILLLIIVVTTLVLRGVDVPTATRILRHQSTNLIQMSQDAPRVLILSAFVSDQGHLLRELIEFTLVFVPLERWLGTYRWLTVFAAGHIGATLTTTIGIWLQARAGAAGRDLLTPVDVGISYGLVAAAGVLSYRLRRPLNAALAVLLITAYGLGAALHGSFTDWGHLSALAIGFAIGPLVRLDPIVPADLGRTVTSSPWERVSAWVTAAPHPTAHHVRRRVATLLAAVLLTTGVAIVVLLGTAHDDSITVPPASGEAIATVLGRPLGCGRQCVTTVVRYSQASGTTDAVLTTPTNTLFPPGEKLTVRVDPRSPTRVLLIQAPRRVQADGLLGAVAFGAILGGIALLLLAQRVSGQGSVSGTPHDPVVG